MDPHATGYTFPRLMVDHLLTFCPADGRSPVNLLSRTEDQLVLPNGEDRKRKDRLQRRLLYTGQSKHVSLGCLTSSNGAKPRSATLLLFRAPSADQLHVDLHIRPMQVAHFKLKAHLCLMEANEGRKPPPLSPFPFSFQWGQSRYSRSGASCRRDCGSTSIPHCSL